MEYRRISTGISTIDEILQGGIPNGSTVIIYGSTNGLKRKLGGIFLQEGINQQEQVVCVTTKYTPKQYSQQLQNWDIDPKKITFVDGASWRIKRFNADYQEMAKYGVKNLTDLNALLSQIMSACKELDPTRLVIDSLSSLLLYTTPSAEQVYKFYELLTSFTRNRDITTYVFLENGVHKSELVNTLSYLSDGQIEVKNNKEEIMVKPNYLVLTEVIKEWVALSSSPMN